MTDQTIVIECSNVIKNILCEALRNYALFSNDLKALNDAEETIHSKREPAVSYPPQWGS